MIDRNNLPNLVGPAGETWATWPDFKTWFGANFLDASGDSGGLQPGDILDEGGKIKTGLLPAAVIINGGNAGEVTVGSTTANALKLAANGVKYTISDTGYLYGGTTASSANGYFRLGLSATSSNVIGKSVNNSTPVFIINNDHNGSTGDFLQFNSIIDNVAKVRASVSKTGKIAIDDEIEITSTKGFVLKDAGDGTRRRVTVVNGVLTVSAAL